MRRTIYAHRLQFRNFIVGPWTSPHHRTVRAFLFFVLMLRISLSTGKSMGRGEASCRVHWRNALVGRFQRCDNPLSPAPHSCPVPACPVGSTGHCSTGTAQGNGPVTFNPLASEFFFLVLAHSVYKMWITQEPNKLALWNKLHFEEKKTESIEHV